MSKARRDQVKAAVAAINAFHATGRRLRAQLGRGNASNEVSRKAESGGYLSREEMDRKARQFADPDVGYSPVQLANLRRLIRKTQPDQDYTLSIFSRSHVVRLLSVQWPRRTRLQRLAVEHGWSLRLLNEEIAADHGTRRQGGRYRRLPDERARLLGVLERECDRWRRMRAALNRKPEYGREPASLAGLPIALVQLVDFASKAIGDLQEAVDKALKRLHPNRVQRMATRGNETGPTKQEGTQKRSRKKAAK
jgi:hypothetical protein